MRARYKPKGKKRPRSMHHGGRSRTDNGMTFDEALSAVNNVVIPDITPLPLSHLRRRSPAFLRNLFSKTGD